MPGRSRVGYGSRGVGHGGAVVCSACALLPGRGGASVVMLQAKSSHRDLRTLSVYTRPGPEAVAHLCDDRFGGR